MEIIYRILMIIFSIIIIVSNHIGNSLFCDIGGVGIIVVSLIYIIWKKNNIKR